MKNNLHNDFPHLFKKSFRNTAMFYQNISNLKPLQQKSLDILMQQDVVTILLTGYGKSLIYEFNYSDYHSGVLERQENVQLFLFKNY